MPSYTPPLRDFQFVLHELLGQDDVKNYDGSWTEWGNMVGVPVKQGSEP